MDGLSKSTDYENIDGVIGFIISEKLATLQELKTVYDLEDKMNLYEAGIVPRMNEYWAHEQAQKNAKRNK